MGHRDKRVKNNILQLNTKATVLYWIFLYWNIIPNVHLSLLRRKTNDLKFNVNMYDTSLISQIARFMEPTWGPSGSCRPQMGPILAPWILLSGMVINPSGDETRIFWKNKVNIIATVALAPCITRSSAAMTLAVHYKQVFVFHGEDLHNLFHCSIEKW